MRNRIGRRGERYSKYGSTVSDGELHFFNLALCLEHILESVLVNQLLIQPVLT